MAIPILGWILAGLFIHPAYIVTSSHDAPMMQLQKESAVFRGKYRIDKLFEMDPDDELRILLALMVVSVSERSKYSGY
jgi:hypothetical protein